jgi:intergrase/recombinase
MCLFPCEVKKCVNYMKIERNFEGRVDLNARLLVFSGCNLSAVFCWLMLDERRVEADFVAELLQRR